jgi:hypothetical protein
VFSDATCDRSECRELSGQKFFGDVFGFKLTEISGELISREILTELSLALFDVKSLPS